jgi:hypothetical protein
MLFAWKQSAAQHETSKEVLLLAAGYNSAIESEIVQVKTGSKLRQLLTKPFHPGAAEPFVCEPKGRIDHLYTFRHQTVELGPSSYITVDVSARSGLQADRVVVEFHETGPEAAAELERAADAAEGAGAKPQWFARLRRRLEDPPDPRDADVRAWRDHVRGVERLLPPLVAEWPGRECAADAADALRRRWSKRWPIGGWRSCCRIMHERGMSGAVRRQVHFPSDDIIAGVLLEEKKRLKPNHTHIALPELMRLLGRMFEEAMHARWICRLADRAHMQRAKILQRAALQKLQGDLGGNEKEERRRKKRVAKEREKAAAKGKAGSALGAIARRAKEGQGARRKPRRMSMLQAAKAAKAAARMGARRMSVAAQAASSAAKEARSALSGDEEKKASK